MTHAVVLAPEAEQDLTRLTNFLGDKSPRAASRAAGVISAEVLSLGEFPHRGYAGPPGLRQFLIPFGRDGYVVRYRVYPDVVLVTRIFHARERR